MHNLKVSHLQVTVHTSSTYRLSERYNRVLSAYMLTLSFKEDSFKPLTLGSSLSRGARGSTARANKRGDKGQPCRVPLCKEKEGDNQPLINTIEQGLMKEGPKPNAARVAKRKSHSMESNAFSLV